MDEWTLNQRLANLAVRHLSAPNAIGEAGSVACGALIRIELELEEGMIRDAAFRAFGCPATLAAADEVAARARGSSLLSAAAISEKEIMEALGLAPAKTASAELAVDALHAALTDAIGRDQVLVPAPEVDEEGVLVGMSGGVDSTVAALLLKESSCNVVGVTLKLWSDSPAADERSCCSPVTVRRAKRVAHSLGIPHLTVDATALFREAVMDYFVEDYRCGRTPNPCIKCNSRVRFWLMLGLARRMGLARVATGHYARFQGEARVLCRGVDLAKDQSYVLSEVDPAVLRHVIFPLGDMTKKAVRALASSSGVEGHDAPESQEICFIPGDDHRKFLLARLGQKPGDIVDRQGTVLGCHTGTYNFTIGQRKGLRVSRPDPYYVTALDPEHDRVVVGEASDLAVRTIEITGITRHASPAGERCLVQLRSSGTPLSARLVGALEPAGGHAPDRLTVHLEEPAIGVATGQTAVVYDGDVVVMAGPIARTGS